MRKNEVSNPISFCVRLKFGILLTFVELMSNSSKQRKGDMAKEVKREYEK